MKIKIITALIATFMFIFSAIILPGSSVFATYECGTYDSGDYGADCSSTTTQTSSSTTGTSTTTTATLADTSAAENASNASSNSIPTNANSTTATTKKVGTTWWPLFLFGALVLIIGGVWLITATRKRGREEKTKAAQAAQNRYF